MFVFPLRRAGWWLAAALLPAWSLWAEEARDVKIVSAVPTEVRAAHGFDPADSAGLFVGIRDFDDPSITEIPYAVDDAVDLAHLFSLELGLIPVEKMTLCLAGDPEKPESKQRLKALARARRCDPGLTQLFAELKRLRTSTGPKGLAVVALASHGFSANGADTVVAMDSQADLLPSLGVSLASLLDQVEQARAPRRLVLVDACRERLTGRRSLGQDPTTVLGQGFLDAMEQSRGTAVLMATVLGGYSYNDHQRRAGVFTAAVIDGLRGEAPADPAGLITVDRLASYVNGRVAAWVRQEKPEGASQSPGITIRAGETARALPLAISPQTYGALAQYHQQRDAALRSLLSLVEREKISGAQYDELKRALAPEEPSSERRGLIAGIEAAQKDDWAVRGLKSYFEEQRPVLLPSTTSPPPSRATGATSWPPPPQAPEAGDEMVEPKLGMRFRYIPPGTFQMGSPETEEGRDDDETQHEVTLTHGFWMGETEVTQKQWRQLMETDPSHFLQCGASCPVEQVNWYEAVAFANKLSNHVGLPACYESEDCTGALGGGCADKISSYCEGDYQCKAVRLTSLECKGYRLPTEAEWEYAARAGSLTALYTGSFTLRGQRHGPELDAIAWYGGNSGVAYEGGWDCWGWPEKQVQSSTHCGTRPVALKQANRWGLHDMLGNVLEWTADQANFESRKVVTETYLDGITDPLSQSGSDRVLRGCSWFNNARFCRSADRGRRTPGFRNCYIGFRLVRLP